MPDPPPETPATPARRGDRIRYMIAGALLWWGVIHQLTAEPAERPAAARQIAAADCRPLR